MRIYFIYIILIIVAFFFGKNSAVAQNGLELSGTDGFQSCNPYDSVFVISVTNNSTAGLFQEGTYSIDWGDGCPVLTDKTYAEISSTTHRYEAYGDYRLIFSAKLLNGTVVSKHYDVRNLGNPRYGLGSNIALTGCIKGESLIVLTDFEHNSDLTVYEVNFGDGTAKKSYSQADLVAMGGVFKHTYTKSSCPDQDGFFYEIKAKYNVECFASTSRGGRYLVVEPPKAAFSFNDPVCTESSIGLKNESTGGLNAGCVRTKVSSWYIDGVGPQKVELPVISFTTPGVHTIKLKVSNGPACSTDSLEKQITVFESAKVDFQISGDDICKNETVDFHSLATGDMKAHKWIVIPDEGVDIVSGGLNQKDAKVRFTRCGTYHVQLYVEDRCTPKSKDTTIIVREDPTVSIVKLDTLCPGSTLVLDSLKVLYGWNCNSREANWEITAPDGTKRTMSGIFPGVPVSEKGNYRLKVTLNGARCPLQKVEAEQTLTVYDTLFRREISASATEICMGETVKFTSNSTAVKLRYDWDLPIESFAAFVAPDNKHSDSPSVKFPKWGLYTVTARLNAVCGKNWNKEFNIKVKTNPKVAFTLNSNICPGQINFADPGIVKYEWNGNAPKATWTITSQSGSPADGCQIVGYDAGNIYPVIDFKKPGSYEIKVTLESAGCPADVPFFAKTIRIRDNNKTLVVSASDTSICVDNEVYFTNSSSAAPGETIIYRWRVEPATGWNFFGGTDSTEHSPTITFTEDGVYKVKSSIETCDQKDTTITIKVKRNPEVKLKKNIAALCPGIYDFHDFIEKYEWYKNKKNVTWAITGNYELQPGTTLNSQYPVVNLKAGLHVLTARLDDVNTACDLSNAMDTCHITVYDSTLTINIKPDLADVCEGTSVSFINTTTQGGGTPAYQWTIDKESGYVFPGGENDKKLPDPQIQFTTWGTYQVAVELVTEGRCNTKTVSFPIIVRGTPEVQLKKLSDICNETTLDLKDSVIYTTNNCDLEYKWTVLPGNGRTIDADNLPFPKINFTQSGLYDITVGIEGQCGGVITASRPLVVLSNQIRAIASPSVEEGCTGLTGLSVDFQNGSLGDNLTYKWTVTPNTGVTYTVGSETSKDATVLITESKNYHVVLKAQNICTSDTAGFDLRIYSPPVIVAATPLIQHVCEKGYVFRGVNELTIDERNDRINKVKWTITPADFEFIAPTSDESKYPELTFKHGTYQLKGEYWNQCGNSGVVNIEVRVDEFIPIAPALLDDSVCHWEPAFELNATPAPGIWSSEDGMVEDRGGAYFYDPRTPGVFEVVYAFTNGGCVARDTMDMHVFALPEVNAGSDAGICINHDPRKLVPVKPVVGGWWEGQGVVRDTFVPDVVGPRPLFYYYIDPVTTCRNVDTMEMTVWKLPDTTFYADRQYCMKADALFRPEEVGVGNQFEWTFGDGNTGISTDNVTHIYDVPGFYNVSLVGVSVHGCRDTSADKTIEIVRIPPPAEFTIDNNVGCGPHVVNISVDTTKYTDKNLLFDWNFGNGVETDSLIPPNPLEYKAGVWDTVYTVSFDVYNRVCLQHWPQQQEISVYSSPAASFSKMHDWECAPIEVRFKNNSTGNRSHYKWFFGDNSDDSVSLEKHPSHIYNSDTITRIYDITLIATNTCGADTFVDQLIVKPQYIKAYFQTPKRNICVNEEICFKNLSSDDSLYIHYKEWDFGDLAKDTTWDACHAFTRDGVFKIHLYIHNGCGFDTISDYVTVHPLPVLTIKSEDYLCENDTFHFSMTSSLPLQRQEWQFGDGTGSLYPEMEHLYEGYGERKVRLWGIAATIGFCRGETEKVVQINPLPVIRITPLDTAVCPPFNYKPGVEGVGFLMWDYGDGTELTSSAEHLYENETDEIIKREVKVYARSDKGCKSDYSGEITLYNVPRAKIGKQMLVKGKPQVVEYINLSEMYDDCIWYLPFDKVVHSFENQQVSFDETELYTTSLVAANRYGCQDSVALEHLVVMRGLYFPNTFIPGNDNTQVGSFNAVGIGLKEYKLEIFDRLGNKVWETTALENGHPSEGWDGRNKDGAMMPQGVYIWRAKAVFIDESVWTGKNGDGGAVQTTQGTLMMLKQR